MSMTQAVSKLPLKGEEHSVPPFRLRARADGGLWYECEDAAAIAVTVQRCFPWSHPFEWISLRDEEGKEVGLIESAETLDSDSGQALLGALGETAFVFEIESIRSVEEQFELRQWAVRLRQGERRFQTRLDAWPRTLPQGGLLFQDVAGDLYLVPHPERLDAASQKLLWAFVDED